MFYKSQARNNEDNNTNHQGHIFRDLSPGSVESSVESTVCSWFHVEEKEMHMKDPHEVEGRIAPPDMVSSAGPVCFNKVCNKVAQTRPPSHL